LSAERRSALMKTPVQPADSGRGKWITFTVLLAIAVFMYAGIMIKVMKYGW